MHSSFCTAAVVVSMDAMGSAASSSSDGSSTSSGAAPHKMFIRLYLLKGKFVPDDTGGAYAAMDPAVWSRLPDDLIWRVMLLLPAAKHFQLQLVSRQWRQVLTSANFRERFLATTAAAVGPAEEPRVIGCVMWGVRVGSDSSDRGGSNGSGGSDGSSSSRGKMVKYVDIDLSFVPASFWTSHCYTVEAAGDGLVCICSGNLGSMEDREPGVNQFCVINPQTRTCRMLPEIPFWPWVWLRTSWPRYSWPLAITNTNHPIDDADWMVATCDMKEGAAAAGQWMVVEGLPQVPDDAVLEVCDGEAYLYYAGRLHVTSAAVAGGPLATVTLDEPKVLDLDWLPSCSSFNLELDHELVRLAPHRGSLFFIAELAQLRSAPPLVCGIWRLVRSSLTWETVAGLTLEEVHRLTQSRYAQRQGAELLYVQAAGDVLCCTLGFKYEENGHELKITYGHELKITVGLSLETGTWELLHDHLLYDQLRHDQAGHGYELVLELRPDLFLS